MAKKFTKKGNLWQQELWDFLKLRVFDSSSTAQMFNPWRDFDPHFAVPRAGEIRRENLKRYIFSFENKPKILILGEALGPKGGRFSGVPFTSEAQLLDGTAGFIGTQTSLREAPYREASSSMFWRALKPYLGQFFQWNCVPYYPNPIGKRMGVRTPTSEEIRTYARQTSDLVSVFAPSAILGIGRKASRSLANLGLPHEYVRHPSHGGAKAFAAGVVKCFPR